ncbi:hypothetical protein [Hymenobacter cellulosivorans]|uniref:Phage tail protein n=1 Tax=Hymenobacter cellulosivorans TaxID=2932249 RepID=A0ABY4F9D6_9BACT|nr:hypothetical protein [Hymenobacter cellulosivorans]UOQ53044.1 hypothetical protein MUN80_25320 [Hymenobacter cellulosivorans]
MAVDICNRISKNVASKACPKAGGINRTSWVFQLDQFTGAETRNGTTGALSGFTLKTGEKGIKAVGRPKKGNGTHKSTTSENGSTEVEQTLVQEYSYQDQNGLTALEQFLAAGSKVVFQELASGDIRVYFKAFGNETSTGEDGTGTLLTDDNNVMKTTLTGKEPSFPMFFQAPITGSETQLAASRAYLDALVEADV